jgi:hypothetical protein
LQNFNGIINWNFVSKNFEKGKVDLKFWLWNNYPFKINVTSSLYIISLVPSLACFTYLIQIFI